MVMRMIRLLQNWWLLSKTIEQFKDVLEAFLGLCHSALVACNLLLLTVFVSPHWQDVVDVLLVSSSGGHLAALKSFCGHKNLLGKMVGLGLRSAIREQRRDRKYIILDYVQAEFDNLVYEIDPFSTKSGCLSPSVAESEDFDVINEWIREPDCSEMLSNSETNQSSQEDLIGGICDNSNNNSMKDVTHLFWVAWVNRDTEEKNCEDNGRMLSNVLDAFLPNAENLEHICLQTGGKHYLGPFDTKGKIQPHEPPFDEELPRLPVPNFYHTLEDILFEAGKTKEGLTWSIHRPTVIFGYSPWSLMNVVGTLSVYVAICKYEELPFKYPGNRITWDQLTDASDAELIAEQEIWAATDRYTKNQASNCSNGDAFKWKQLWKLMADKFELELLPYEGESFSLAEAMKDKGPVWDAIVKDNKLYPTIEEVGNWWFVDLMLNKPVANFYLVNKSKEYGFFGFQNTKLPS